MRFWDGPPTNRRKRDEPMTEEPKRDEIVVPPHATVTHRVPLAAWEVRALEDLDLPDEIVELAIEFTERIAELGAPTTTIIFHDCNFGCSVIKGEPEFTVKRPGPADGPGQITQSIWTEP